MNIPELQKEIHEYAKEKGWWDNERSAGEIYALIHSEISEAVECARNGEVAVWHEIKNYQYPGDPDIQETERISRYPQNGEKPQGELIELADVVIRILDYAESRGYKIGSLYLECYESPENHLEFYNEIHAILAHHANAFIQSSWLTECIARIQWFCEKNKWDLWKAVRCKMEYNKTRPYRHGGKKY